MVIIFLRLNRCEWVGSISLPFVSGLFVDHFFAIFKQLSRFFAFENRIKITVAQ
jgi:hypothetical protein